MNEIRKKREREQLPKQFETSDEETKECFARLGDSQALYLSRRHAAEHEASHFCS